MGMEEKGSDGQSAAEKFKAAAGELIKSKSVEEQAIAKKETNEAAWQRYQRTLQEIELVQAEQKLLSEQVQVAGEVAEMETVLEHVQLEDLPVDAQDIYRQSQAHLQGLSGETAAGTSTAGGAEGESVNNPSLESLDEELANLLAEKAELEKGEFVQENLASEAEERGKRLAEVLEQEKQLLEKYLDRVLTVWKAREAVSNAELPITTTATQFLKDVLATFYQEELDRQANIINGCSFTEIEDIDARLRLANLTQFRLTQAVSQKRYEFSNNQEQDYAHFKHHLVGNREYTEEEFAEAEEAAKAGRGLFMGQPPLNRKQYEAGKNVEQRIKEFNHIKETQNVINNLLLQQAYNAGHSFNLPVPKSFYHDHLATLNIIKLGVEINNAEPEAGLTKVNTLLVKDSYTENPHQKFWDRALAEGNLQPVDGVLLPNDLPEAQAVAYLEHFTPWREHLHSLVENCRVQLEQNRLSEIAYNQAYLEAVEAWQSLEGINKEIDSGRESEAQAARKLDQTQNNLRQLQSREAEAGIFSKRAIKQEVRAAEQHLEAAKKFDRDVRAFMETATSKLENARKKMEGHHGFSDENRIKRSKATITEKENLRYAKIPDTEI